MNDSYSMKFDKEEILFLQKWLGKIVDRGDLLEEIQEDNEENVANGLYQWFSEYSFEEIK